MRMTVPMLTAAMLIIVAAPSPAGAADPAAGAAVFQRCIGCHTIGYNRTGPKLEGLFGRRAGSVPGFAYSESMRASGMVWGETTLDRFLQAPRQVVPGTKMTYAGVADAVDRANLIAYLKKATAAGGGGGE